MSSGFDIIECPVSAFSHACSQTCLCLVSYHPRYICVRPVAAARFDGEVAGFAGDRLTKHCPKDGQHHCQIKLSLSGFASVLID